MLKTFYHILSILLWNGVKNICFICVFFLYINSVVLCSDSFFLMKPRKTFGSDQHLYKSFINKHKLQILIFLAEGL